jgi:phosphohistidine swiveling domain-containing protein
VNNQNFLDYVKSQKWFFGKRDDEPLLFYSARTDAYKYIKHEYGINFAETLLISFKEKYPIRVFNLWQAKNFHSASNEKILKNPRLLSYYVKKDNLLYQKIDTQGEKLLSAIKEDNFNKSVRLFNEILSFYEIASAHFIIIFSLGFKLAENINNLKNIDDVVKKHDTWRNSVVFKEEAMSEHLFHFFKYLLIKKKLTLDPLLLMKFLTISEVKAWLNNELNDTDIENKIKPRKNNGFVYVNLRDKGLEIVDDFEEIKEIQKYFVKLDTESKKSKNSDEISGLVACNARTLVSGKVIIIKDRSELRSKSHLINGNILVAVQTTPHFVPYMKKVKAIITDEGGITCHAAIIAREFSIPCVVGTKTATQILKDNDFVEINTDNGVIKIKKK